MNSIYFSEEHTILRNQIRRFVEQKVVPVADEWEEKGYIPREILQQMGDLGFLGIRYSTDYGGSEMDALGSVILAEELGRSTFGGLAVTVLVHTDMASPHLDNFGNKQQLNKYMSEIISGQKITGVAVTEPDVGSDVAAMKTRAVKDGNDYVINGSKMFITNGVHGDLFFVAAKTDMDVKPSRGITIFAVEKGTPGFSVGKNLKKMGWLSSDTAELIFDNCRVPADNIIGELNKGFYSIMRNFQNERLVLGAQSMGEASKALELTMDYVTTRKAFGGVLFDKQAIRQRLAALAARVEAGKQLVYHSAWLDAQGLDCIKEVSMVKAYCGELVNEVMYDCLQFHGGFGYVRESAIERMYRDARIQAIAGGATEVMLEEVSKRMIN
ncbi:MAG: acyl-CoA dehydrogenase [Cycloclasticus pugetii]|jgi:acyl-CoA dehydrogenase|uniref:Short-chain acyl-CoA dehydrogenase n=1 Tax=Cycloclasticus zancles 78-ME TaxID=1198232 RepID=S5TX02_9GAMM|nr:MULTISPECIES: acyl-CoA dehydrogenase family protein [Cycloclasticus]AGS39528.1 Short-chain acyl-CoA dehydrogenase [Cycloclasticus zancles 78-ME]MDF1830182.1 acyl-CoA dehydrogenase family protein [Cycloclasticus pugetii]PHR48280.1 MAG: acyl-CoA dehydrogenase [Cycloclasticus sp.]